MEKSFCDFLVNIGLIDIKTSNILRNMNKEISKTRKEFSFTDSFFISLMHYFNNLSINQKKYMCFSLPLRYILLNQKELKQKLKSIFIKKNLKEKFLKMKFLLRWLKSIKLDFKIEKNTKIDEKENKHNLLDDDSGSIALEDFMLDDKRVTDKINKKKNKNFAPFSYENKNKKMEIKNNNIPFNKSRSSNFFNKKMNEILTTSDRMELLQLSECTFKPTINTANNSFRISNTNSNQKTTFIKLYQDNEKYRIKKHLKALELEQITNRDLTFKPNIYHTPKTISHFKFDSFEERQKNFINNKKLKSIKLKTNIEKSAEQKCSFTPRINSINDFTSSSMFNYNKNNYTYSNINTTNSNKKNQKYNLAKEENKQDNNNMNMIQKNNNTNNNSYYSLSTTKSVPAHLRLYDDSKRRNSSNIQKDAEYQKLINDMANRSSSKNMKVNYDKLFNLYENKEGKIILEKTKLKVQKEEGVTFKPEIDINNKYLKRIYNNFYERNKNHSKNEVFKEYEKFDENYKKNDKKYTQEQKKKIINNIVERLYKEPMNKNLLKNMNESNKYDKNFSYAESPRNNIQNKIDETKINLIN